jgi:hypothetical protein
MRENVPDTIPNLQIIYQYVIQGISELGNLDIARIIHLPDYIVANYIENILWDFRRFFNMRKKSQFFQIHYRHIVDFRRSTLCRHLATIVTQSRHLHMITCLTPRQ